MKAVFIVNRRSGVRRRLDVARILRQSCAWDYAIAECERKEDLDWMVAEAARNAVDIVYAVGGDGTVSEVAKRLIRTPMALGILPTGSGNGFARHIGLPIDAAGSVAACSEGRVVEIDTASVNGMPFLATMGVGFDAWVAEQFASSDVRGFATYARITMRGLLRYRAAEYDIAIDDAEEKRTALIVAVANASQYGSNARIAPLASLQDGLLDLIIVERVSPLAIPRLFAGSFDRASGVVMHRGRRIVIRRPAAGAAHLDGEPVSLPETLTVEVVPRSLRVLVPNRTQTI